MSRSFAVPKKSTTAQSSSKDMVSKSLFFTSLALVALISFVLGTRSGDIMAVVGPSLGFKVPQGEIDLSSVEKTYEHLSANYDGKLNKSALITGANQGLVSAAGDKFTVYLDKKDAETFSNDLSGKVGSGIGVQIALRNNVATIIEVLPGNPAAKAGLKADDAIIAVNGHSTEGWSSEKVASAVRGETGTTVKITVSRESGQQEYSLTRQTINNPSVTGKEKDGLGILSITRFDENTATLARQAAQNFKNQNVKGVIVDLRDNGGGYVDAAQSVASLWLNDKTVMTEKTNGKVTDKITSDNDPILDGVPTIVLVNGNTASASEIVSGALQDYGVAKLIGTKTYGKGTMQEVMQLGGGNELKVTIAHWFTPKNRTINGKGLTPDRVVDLTPQQLSAGQDPQMAAAVSELSK